MSETFPSTSAAFARLRFTLRALACETVFGWAERLCPKGYKPSYVEAMIDAYRHEGAFANLKAKQSEAGK